MSLEVLQLALVFSKTLFLEGFAKANRSFLDNSLLCLLCSLTKSWCVYDLGWNICGARSPQSEQLQIHLTTLSNPRLSSFDDSYCWRINDQELSSFSAKKTWESVRQREEEKPWTSNVWFKGSIRKYSYTMWLAHLDRLPTRFRMVIWGLNTSSNCCFCDLELECRDHLSLLCEDSFHQVWLSSVLHLRFVGAAAHLRFLILLKGKEVASYVVGVNIGIYILLGDVIISWVLYLCLDMVVIVEEGHLWLKQQASLPRQVLLTGPVTFGTWRLCLSLSSSCGGSWTMLFL